MSDLQILLHYYALDQVVYKHIDVCMVMLQCPLFCRFYPKYKRKSGRFSIVSTNSFEGSAPLPNALGSTPMYAVVDKSKKVQLHITILSMRSHHIILSVSFSVTIVPTLFVLVHW